MKSVPYCIGKFKEIQIISDIFWEKVILIIKTTADERKTSNIS